MKFTQLCLTLCDTSPGQHTGVGSLSLLQGIFPTQRLSPGLPHCRHILYLLSHKGKDRNGKDLTEAEEMKKNLQEYTEELYKKVLITWITMMVLSLT